MESFKITRLNLSAATDTPQQSSSSTSSQHTGIPRQDIDSILSPNSSNTLTTLPTEYPLRTTDIIKQKPSLPKDHLEYIVDILQSPRVQENTLDSIDLELNEIHNQAQSNSGSKSVSGSDSGSGSGAGVGLGSNQAYSIEQECILVRCNDADFQNNKNDNNNYINIFQKFVQSVQLYHPIQIQKRTLVIVYILYFTTYFLSMILPTGMRWFIVGLGVDMVMQALSSDTFSILTNLAVVIQKIIRRFFKSENQTKISGKSVQFTSFLLSLVCTLSSILAAFNGNNIIIRIFSGIMCVILAIATGFLVSSNKTLADLFNKNFQIEQNVQNEDLTPVQSDDEFEFLKLYKFQKKSGYLQIGNQKTEVYRIQPHLFFCLQDLLKICTGLNSVVVVLFIQQNSEITWQIFAYLGIFTTALFLISAYLYSVKNSLKINFKTQEFILLYINILWTVCLLGLKSTTFVKIICIPAFIILSFVNILQNFYFQTNNLFLIFAILQTSWIVLLANYQIFKIFALFFMAQSILSVDIKKVINNEYYSIFLTSVIMASIGNALIQIQFNNTYLTEFIFVLTLTLFIICFIKSFSGILVSFSLGFSTKQIVFLLALSQLFTLAQQIHKNNNIYFYNQFSNVLFFLYVYIIILLILKGVLQFINKNTINLVTTEIFDNFQVMQNLQNAQYACIQYINQYACTQQISLNKQSFLWQQYSICFLIYVQLNIELINQIQNYLSNSVYIENENQIFGWKQIQQQLIKKLSNIQLNSSDLWSVQVVCETIEFQHIKNFAEKSKNILETCDYILSAARKIFKNESHIEERILKCFFQKRNQQIKTGDNFYANTDNYNNNSNNIFSENYINNECNSNIVTVLTWYLLMQNIELKDRVQFVEKLKKMNIVDNQILRKVGKELFNDQKQHQIDQEELRLLKLLLPDVCHIF